MSFEEAVQKLKENLPFLTNSLTGDRKQVKVYKDNNEEFSYTINDDFFPVYGYIKNEEVTVIRK